MLQKSPEIGLTSDEASKRLAEDGPNRLPERKAPGPLAIFFRQFLSPFIYILAVAAIVALLVGQTPSAVFIAAVLVLNAVIGAVQEFSAQRSATALRNIVRGSARVVRDGEPVTIDIEEVVRGDLVLIGSGDRTPADLQLIDDADLHVDESMLTGESIAVSKDAKADVPADAPLAEHLNRCFAGSTVMTGRGRGLVTATGEATQIGKIASRMTEKRTSEPPLLIRIRAFTYQVGAAILVAIALLTLLMLARGGYDATAMVMMGISLAVSTIPEGLPAALTVALAIGMRRMAAANVIIRKLVAVEALGSCTFICSDKTGTLTVNKLTIQAAVLPSGRAYDVSGVGLGPGRIEGEARETLRDLCLTGVLANESRLDYARGDWNGDGDIVDLAFLVFAKKFGLSINETENEFRRLSLIPYESERAFSGSVNVSGAEHPPELHVKGSPEKLLAGSTHMMTDDGPAPIDKELIERQFEDLARQGYRVIALAKRQAEGAPTTGAAGETDPLQNLTFLGMVAMSDPIRPEARDAIERCRIGGIQVAMITGDHPETARAIGAQLGLCEQDAAVVTGPMIKASLAEGPAAARDLILPARVFARIEPIQKETIVQTFIEDGHFVGVTGDGVNDAPAMRKANAGVAMGKSGSDVAKEAADLIITDDNFASLVAGVEQGRIVYNNIRKVISLLTATGFSALLLFFLSVAAGLPMPLTAVQLLWLNLVANGLQDVALAFEPGEGDELSRKPRSPAEPIFERRIIEHILVAGSAMGVIAFAVFWTATSVGVAVEEARNLTLLTMVLFGNVHALSSRSESRSIFRIPYVSNRFLAIAAPGALAVHLLAMQTPGLRGVLELQPVSITAFCGVLAAALTFLAVEELHKLTLRRRASSRAATARA
ncbi:MAG: HAD-IC family P-type ATPase [Pseudomonadota bacterium]